MFFSPPKVADLKPIAQFLIPPPTKPPYPLEILPHPPLIVENVAVALLDNPPKIEE